METIVAPITKLAQLDPEGYYTYADYLNWKFQERVELIRSHLFPMGPAPNLTHQRVIRRNWMKKAAMARLIW